MSDSDDRASNSGSEPDSEADARRAARVEMLLANLSDEARKMLYGMHGKLSRLSIVKRMRRILAKRPEMRTPEDIEFLMSETKDLDLFHELSKEKHADMCRLLHAQKVKDKMMVSNNLYVSSYYFVLIGKIQVETRALPNNANGPDEDEVEEIKSKRTSKMPRVSTSLIAKQLLDAEMEAEAAKTGANADVRVEELRNWFEDVDEVGTGLLSVPRVSAALVDLLKLESEEEVEPMMKVLGEREEGEKISFDQFVTIMEKGVPGGYLTWWHRIQR
mmetsp:Transcript_16563/g.36023  ORF Transcript_16563/g.36023 Transcript_16563/m.36023 type:complete len:274 (-) Transcript_16563:2010-2831(-)